MGQLLSGLAGGLPTNNNNNNGTAVDTPQTKQ
jgi:hypothetical protein